LKKVAYGRGYEELSPKKTAKELLKGSAKVAITTRFANHSYALAYVDALQSQGIQARITTDSHKAVEDFCFLKRADRLVGQSQSTFLQWAGFLGNASRVRLYTVESPQNSLQKKGGQVSFLPFNWTHPMLKDRINYHRYDSEEMEAFRANHSLEA
jgi:hypothetical protein